jgi:polysaccharide pyruvyl transferase WcaK-like protein
MKNPLKIIHFHPETRINKGDIAIAESIEDLLKENVDVSKYTHGFIEHLRKMKYPRLIHILSIHKNISRFFPQFFPFKNFYIWLRKNQINRIVRRINKNDLFVIGGGGIYSNFFFPLDKRILSKIKIPIIIFSPGVNINLNSPGLTNDVKESIKYLNKIARLSSVRDSYTLRYLKNQLKKGTENIGCPALFLKEKECNYVKIDAKNFNLGVNIANHSKSITKEKLDEIINLYLRIIGEFSKKVEKPLKIYYFQHFPKEKVVIKKLKNKGLSFRVINFKPKKMKSYYRKMDFVIPMMLHSCIFSFGSKTKFFNFAYSVKNIAFMNDIRQKQNLVKINCLGDFNKIFEGILKALNSKIVYDKNSKMVEFIHHIQELKN